MQSAVLGTWECLKRCDIWLLPSRNLVWSALGNAQINFLKPCVGQDSPLTKLCVECSEFRERSFSRVPFPFIEWSRIKITSVQRTKTH